MKNHDVRGSRSQDAPAKPLRSSRRAKGAFTLIELLVVIAIIAILAAILFPVFARARAKARQTACLSNAKQMALSAMMYTQDYDEQFMEVYRCEANGRDASGNCVATTNVWPSASVNNPSTGQPYGWYTSAASGLSQFSPNWAYILQPYAKNRNIFSCPDGNPIWRPATNTDNAGYIYSNWIADTGEGKPAKTMAAIKAPASTILFFETGKSCSPVEYHGYNGIDNWGDYCTDQTLNHVAEDPSDSAAINDCPRCYSDWSPKHNGGRNIVFCDGHAKWMKDSNDYIRNHRQMWAPECQP